MTITKNTIFGISAAGVLTLFGSMWVAVAEVQGAFNQLSINTMAIENIGTAMELRGIDRIIESKSKEIRDKQVDIINAGSNPALIQLLNTQISELQEEITRQRVIRECVVDPTKKVCK